MVHTFPSKLCSAVLQQSSLWSLPVDFAPVIMRGVYVFYLREEKALNLSPCL